MPHVIVLGGGASGRGLLLSVEPLGRGLVSYEKGAPFHPACEDTGEGAVYESGGGPLPDAHSASMKILRLRGLQNCGTQMSLADRFPSLWNCVTGARRDYDTTGA